MNTFAALLLVIASTQAEGRAITYAEAIEAALQANPAVISAEAGVAEARGRLVGARGGFDPLLSLYGGREGERSESFFQLGQVYAETGSLNLGTSLSQTTGTGTWWSLQVDAARRSYLYQLVETGQTWEPERPQYISMLTLNLRQSLLKGHRLAYNLQEVREAERGLDRAAITAAADAMGVAAEAASAYWNLRHARELEDIAQDALEVAEEEARVVEAMVRAGRLAPMERTRVAAAVVEVRAHLLEAENDHHRASDNLSAIMGARPGVLLRAVSIPDPPEPLALDVELVVDKALANNLDLQVVESELESARAALANARHGLLPDLRLDGRAGAMGYSTSMSGAVNDMGSFRLPFWYLGADLAVPLGNREDRGAEAQARAALTAAQASRAALEHSLSIQVRDQVRVILAGEQRLELAKANLALTEATLAAEKALQREGRAIEKDVLEAQRRVRDAQADLSQARIRHAVALVELGRLQGRLEGAAVR